MRERENTEAAEAGSGIRAKRATPSGGGLPQHRLLALQGTMGNAAVVQLLRSSGHPGAQDEHQHGADCGHEHEERPTVQRSAVHDVLRSGGRPLAGTDNGDGLRVSDPSDRSDRFEREAEATATRVMAGALPVRSAAHPPDEEHSLPASSSAAVQRTVTIGGAKVDDPALLIKESDLDDLLVPTGRQVLNYLKHPGVDVTLEAKDSEELLLEVGRIAAMIDLVHSINTSGILGRRTLVQQGIAHTGSNDRGSGTALAVNVLDARGARDLAQIQDVVTKSLTEPNNGSFSVAMERPQDDDMILDEMAGDLDGVALSEEELADIREAAQGDESMARVLTSAMKRERLSDAHGATVAQYVALLQERTQNTAMAIIDTPGSDVATLSPGVGSYESDVPSDKIQPGEGGFTSLVLPAWFEPYGPLLMTREWPKGVDLRFAGTKKITAHYRAKGTDWPVTVEAPDYGSEIQSQLQQFKVIATHILKISSL